MPTTTAKGFQVPVGTDPANVPADMLTLADEIDARAWGGVFTTSQRDLLVAPNVWSGMVIWNSTTGELEVNASGAGGSSNWSPALAYVPPADPSAATPGIRTLGSGAQQAAPGSWLASASALVAQLGATAIKSALALVVGDISGAAPLAAPAFSGAPTAPTPGSGDNSTRLATTAYVKAQPYAPVASPTFTGNPQAPTVANSDDSGSLATSAFVQNLLAALGYVQKAANLSDLPSPATALANLAGLPKSALTFTGSEGAFVGSAPPAGTIKIIRQATVVATVSNTSGGWNFNYHDSGFANGVVSVVVTPGDSASGLAFVRLIESNCTKTAVNGQAYGASGAFVGNGGPIRLNYYAIGW